MLVSVLTDTLLVSTANALSHHILYYIKSFLCYILQIASLAVIMDMTDRRASLSQLTFSLSELGTQLNALPDRTSMIGGTANNAAAGSGTVGYSDEFHFNDNDTG
jgi:hypothetical protein